VRTKEDVDEVGVASHRHEDVFDREGVVERAVHQTRRVDKGDQVEVALLKMRLDTWIDRWIEKEIDRHIIYILSICIYIYIYL